MQVTDDPNLLRTWLNNCTDGSDVAFDTETNGLTVFGNPDFRMVGIGFSDADSGIYYSCRDDTFADIREILLYVHNILTIKRMRLLAYNLFFDASVLHFYLRDTAAQMPYHADVYGLHRYLASEGWFNQQYGLKYSQQNLLLWNETNEVLRDEWLINHGYVSGVMGVTDTDTPIQCSEKVHRIAEGIAAGKKYKVDKGQMWRCPPSILGPYCILDAYSTFQLYREVMMPAINKYCTDFFMWFHTEVFVKTLVLECVKNYADGIFIDRDILEKYDVTLTTSLGKMRKQIYRAFPEVINKINRDLLKKHAETCPEVRYKVVHKTDGVCPPKYTKNGQISKNYIKYELRQRKYRKQLEVGGEITKNYARYRMFRRQLLRWQRICPVYDEVIVPEAFKPYIFNLNSADQRRQLLYHNLTYTVIEDWVDEKHRGSFRLSNGIELEYNKKSGELPTGKPAVMAILGIDSIINKYTMELKKQQFTHSVLNKITPQSYIHLPVKVPGTLTTRLGGDGGVNIQNMPKDAMFQSAWRVENPFTHVIADLDIAALEPHVLTELSRDRAMMGLYGPGAKPNDVYIYSLALMGGLIGQPFLDLGYDPNNPTAEAIGLCKKKLKSQRAAGKTLVLSDDYGSSAGKKWRTLLIQGHRYSYGEVKVMHDKLHEVYAGKKLFGKKLEAEWERNGGFVLDGLGFPVSVCEKKKKDLMNRVVQKTGHQNNMLLLYKVVQLMRQYAVPYRWLIVDYHDATDPIVPVEHARTMRKIYTEAFNWLNNEMLRGDIKIKGDPQFASNMAEVKCENYELDDDDLIELLEELNEDDE